MKNEISVTTVELARALGYQAKTISSWLRKGKLRGTQAKPGKPGSDWMISLPQARKACRAHGKAIPRAWQVTGGGKPARRRAATTTGKCRAVQPSLFANWDTVTARELPGKARRVSVSGMLAVDVVHDLLDAAKASGYSTGEIMEEACRAYLADLRSPGSNGEGV